MISLVVPVYNMEQFLPRCIGALVKQKGNFEIILVNDGSTDSSGGLCDQYALQYPELVRVVHKRNGGLSSARNAGMDAACGEYVIFPDPDDWVEPDFVQKLTELNARYKCDLVCIGHYVDTDTSSIQANKEQKLVQMNVKQAQRALLIPPSINGFAWNKLYHLQVIRKNNLRFLDNVGTTEDLDFAFRYLQHSKTIVFSPQDAVYHYCQREGAATHSGFSNKKMESIHTYEKIIASSDDDGLIRAAKEEICNTAINLIWSYQESKSQDQYAWKKLRYYIRKYLRYYCTSQKYGGGRKVQAVLAFYTPKLYARLKNKISGSF